MNDQLKRLEGLLAENETTTLFTSLLNITLVFLGARPACLLELNGFETKARDSSLAFLKAVSEELQLVTTQESTYRWFVAKQTISKKTTDRDVGEALGFECADYVKFKDMSQRRVSVSIVENTTQTVVYAEVCATSRKVDVQGKCTLWNEMMQQVGLKYRFTCKREAEMVSVTSLLLEENFMKKNLVEDYSNEYAQLLINYFYWGCQLGTEAAPLLENWEAFQFVMHHLSAIDIWYNEERFDFQEHAENYDFLVGRLRTFEKAVLKCGESQSCFEQHWNDLSNSLQLRNATVQDA